MKKKSLFITLILMLGLSMILGACSSGASSNPDELSIVTGGTGGTYYPLGGEIAKIMEKATGKTVTAQVSGASVENMTTLQDDAADLAFTQTDIASYATKGELMFKDGKVDNIQAIGTLYPETIQIVTLKDSGIKSVEDLKGKTVSVGAPGSGTYANAEQILEIHGLSMDDINARNLSFDESTSGIQDGQIDAAFITAGAPTGAVESLAAVKEVSIVPIAEDKIEALAKKYPYYAKDVIPAGTYKLENEVTTPAVLSMLVVRKDLDEDLVYDLTKALFENKITHAKGQYIKAENALNGLGIDLHPGAKKYYKEKGLLK